MVKVENFYNKNQFLITTNEGITFQSYDSQVAFIANDGTLKLGDDWDYSHTTLKYLYLFLNDYQGKIKITQYKYIFSRGFKNLKNKRKFLQDLVDKKIIEVMED